VRTLTVRLSEKLAAQIEAESKARQLTKSDVVRERLEATEGDYGARTTALDTIADLVGSIDRLPDDLSSRKRHYLTATGYGKRSR
jgi:Arc/MetJ-type ribon-helix-helix transcriptional regulator